jgi:hypothetical protein
MTTGKIHKIGNLIILEWGGPLLAKAGDALELIGATHESQADWIALPVACLDPSFFQLRTGFAGEFMQKLVNYGLRLAIVGDISDHTAESKALGDFVYESNRRGPTWFVDDMASLLERLAGAPHG